MRSAYNRYLQEEAEEYREDEDSATTDGYLMDLTGEPLEDENEDSEIFRMTGIY